MRVLTRSEIENGAVMIYTSFPGTKGAKIIEKDLQKSYIGKLVLALVINQYSDDIIAIGKVTYK